jgi:ABC-type transporter MlaC component
MKQSKSDKIDVLVRCAAAIAVLLTSFSPAVAQEGPLQIIRKSNDEILELYRTDPGGPESNVNQQVFDVMDRVTSFSTISDEAIEGLCDPAAGDDCETFKKVFQELLRVSSVNKLGRYRADSFDYLGEDLDGEVATVRTIAQYGEDEIELDYYLMPVGESWVISNYVVDGVDTIKNYRKQFTRMLRVSSVETVIERLRNRIDALEADS